MDSCRSFKLLLAFLLLFGQFSSLAHALEHLVSSGEEKPCAMHAHDNQQSMGYGQVHSHRHIGIPNDGLVAHAGIQPSSNPAPASDFESSESITCLIYHLHGSLHMVLPATPVSPECFACPCTEFQRETAVLIPVSIHPYEVRGPPIAA